jgi:very-short-patch-repair endonuclease
VSAKPTDEGGEFDLRNAKSIERAKFQRKEMTPAEARTWSLLRDRRFNQVKFRRQHAIGPYVADFACVTARLVVEIDGAIHNLAEQQIFDEKRTAFLKAAGWKVLRISNDEVFNDMQPVIDRIYEAL